MTTTIRSTSKRIRLVGELPHECYKELAARMGAEKIQELLPVLE
jgi:hypothetical protein